LFTLIHESSAPFPQRIGEKIIILLFAMGF
jgi:hypothetical protein